MNAYQRPDHKELRPACRQLSPIPFKRACRPYSPTLTRLYAIIYTDYIAKGAIRANQIQIIQGQPDPGPLEPPPAPRGLKTQPQAVQTSREVRWMGCEGVMDHKRPLGEPRGPAGPAGESRAKDPDPTHPTPAARGLDIQSHHYKVSRGVI